MALTVQLSGSAIPFFAQLQRRFTPKQVNRFAAASVADLVRKHIRVLERNRPNKMGFPRAHFWNKSAESVRWSATATEGVVSVAREGFRYQYYGGTIRPVNKTALTIPIHPKAYNRRAPDFDLTFIPRKASDPQTTRGYLVTRNGNKIEDWYYVLKSVVSKRPDRSVLPTDAQLQREATEGVRREIDLLMR